MEERIGLSTAGERSLFEMSNGVSELTVRRDWRLAWWLFTAVGLGVGAACAQTAF